MARVPSVAQTEQTFRPLSTAARKLAVTGRSCANCGSLEIRPSNRRNALDILLACLFLAPFRCRVCRVRFYRVWRPSLQNPDPPVAPLLVVAARNKLAEPEITGSRRIEPEPVHPRNNQPRLIPAGRELEPMAPAPIQRPEAKRELSPQPIAAPSRGPILILEDDLSIRKLLRRLLERRGYHTVEVAQADDLGGQLLDRRVDLLVVDVSTVEDGVQAVIKLARAIPSLKILALSAEPLPDNELADRLLVLPKPFPLDSFVDCVDQLLERSNPPITAP
jgi:CheY-like chemotaxis protein